MAKSKAKLSNPEIGFVLNEADQLYDYYKRTLDERKFLIEYYAKLVAAPSGIIGVITTYFLSAGSHQDLFRSETLTSLLALISFTIFSAGVALYVTYALESRNSKNYEDARHEIRDELERRYPSLAGVITIHKKRRRTGNIIFSVSFWRGAYIIAINSSVFALFIGLASLRLSLVLLFSRWAGSVVGHIVLSATARKKYVAK